MYLRTTRRKKKDGTAVEYYQLAETRWNPQTKRPEVQVIHNFGRADLLDPAELQRLARSIMRACNGGLEAPEEVGVDPSERIEIEWSKPLGGVHVARGLWEELGVGACLRQLAGKEKRRAPHEAAIFAMVANRLLAPRSKPACYEQWLPDLVFFPEGEKLTLDQLYLAMDFLEDHVDTIEEAVFLKTADLFNCDVDLIFWDTTTFYFEIDEEDEEEYPHHDRHYPALRKRGHSKDDKGGNPQVVVGLAVTRDGLPVRSWVFPGNTMDATTVAKVKEHLRGWRLGRAIFVADAGMDSEENRRALSRGLGKYILAMPVGKLKEVSEQVLSHPGRYKQVNDHLAVKEVVIGDGERRRRYIVCRNLHDAERQRKHRAIVLKELEHEIERLDRSKKDHPKRACELLSSTRYGQYLSQTERGRVRLDRAKIKKAERMDGRYVLLTNDDTISAEDAGQGYKAMMIIEACFRRMKAAQLRTRPIYHWTPHRIISHVKLCVLALLLERAAEIRTGQTWRTLSNDLEQLQAVRYRVGGKTIVQTTRPSPAVRRHFATLRIPMPKRVQSVGSSAS